MSSTGCGCTARCGDDGDVDGPGVCKGLPQQSAPLVEIVLVDRSAPVNAWEGVPLGVLSDLAAEAGFDPSDCC